MAFKSRVVQLTTADQDIYECGAGVENSVHGLVFGNLTGAGQTITIKLHKQNTNSTSTLGVLSVAAADTRAWPKPINLEPGDKIIASAGANSVVTVEASVYEQTGSTPITTGITPRGDYAGGTTYASNDLVADGGIAYLSMQPGNIGHTPASSPAYWMVLTNPAEVLGFNPTSVVGLEGVQSVADFKIGLSLVKADVGLTNADDTSDLDKPISDATQNALDLKADDADVDAALALKADAAATTSALALKENAANKGIAGGYAPLDGSNKVAVAYLPDAVLGALKYQGTWNANTNSPAIPTAAAGNKGYYYIVATAGATSIDSITDWKVGDWLVSNGTTWDKVDNTDAVSSVAGLTGVISSASLRTALSISNVEDKSSATIRGELTAANVTGALTYTPTSVTGLTGVQSVAAFKTGLSLISSDVGLGNVENKSSATIRGELTSANVTGALTFTPLDAASKAAGSDVRTGTNDTKYLTSKALTDAAAPQVLTDAATIAWNMASGFNAKVTLGGNRTFGTPTNPIEGVTYRLEVIQDGTGSRTGSYPTAFDFGSVGTPTLSTGAGKIDFFYLDCYDAVTPKFRVTFSKAA